VEEFWFEVPYTSRLLVMVAANTREEALERVKDQDYDYDDNCLGETYDFDNIFDHEL